MWNRLSENVIIQTMTWQSHAIHTRVWIWLYSVEWEDVVGIHSLDKWAERDWSYFGPYKDTRCSSRPVPVGLRSTLPASFPNSSWLWRGTINADTSVLDYLCNYLQIVFLLLSKKQRRVWTLNSVRAHSKYPVLCLCLPLQSTEWERMEGGGERRGGGGTERGNTDCGNNHHLIHNYQHFPQQPHAVVKKRHTNSNTTTEVLQPYLNLEKLWNAVSSNFQQKPKHTQTHTTCAS